jgi:hypothetical protein
MCLIFGQVYYANMSVNKTRVFETFDQRQDWFQIMSAEGDGLLAQLQMIPVENRADCWFAVFQLQVVTIKD